MKKMFFVTMLLMFSFFVSLTVWAGEIIPTTPVEIIKPAVRIVDYSITFTPESIEVKLNYYDVNSNIVQHQFIVIDGTDFNSLMNTTIQGSHAGKKFSDIMFKAIRTKCRDKLGIVGTVN